MESSDVSTHLCLEQAEFFCIASDSEPADYATQELPDNCLELPYTSKKDKKRLRKARKQIKKRMLCQSAPQYSQPINTSKQSALPHDPDPELPNGEPRTQSQSTKPQLHPDHIVWTLPSTGVAKALPTKQNETPELHCEQSNPKSSSCVEPVADASLLVPLLADMTEKTLLQFLIAHQYSIATHPLNRDYARHWSPNGASEHILGECNRRKDCSMKHVQFLIDECLEFGLLADHRDQTHKERTSDNVPVPTSTSEQPCEQLASTSLRACAPALRDRVSPHSMVGT